MSIRANVPNVNALRSPKRNVTEKWDQWFPNSKVEVQSSSDSETQSKDFYPNSITFPIDFVFILMYFSIVSQKFFTPHPPKVFYPTLKSFLPPPRRPLPFDLSTLLSLDKSHTSSGSMNKNGGRRWGKKLFTGVKN